MSKPRWRGASHQAFTIVAAAGTAWLISQATSVRAALAGAVYGASLVAQYSVSALYHRGRWTEAGRERMRKLDHSCIFLLIAGTYTPFCLLALPVATGPTLLAVVWSGATLGVAKAVFWAGAPRAATAALYVLLGWCVVPWFDDFGAAIGRTGTGAMLVGGALYSAGALVYASKRPDPLPTLFGFHEVFHLMVILASICHFAVVAALVAG